MAKKLFFHIFLLTILQAAYSSTFTFTNNCPFTVWPGILSNAGIPPLQPTGFTLLPAQSKLIPAPSSWAGRFWARTHCTLNPTTNKFSCVTGDCGSTSNTLECNTNGASPPATLAEFTLNGDGGKDFYDVSLVDGYNLPMLVVPKGGTGDCTSTGCVKDLNDACPLELQVSEGEGGVVVACRSACEAFGSEEYCCSGAFGTPDKCGPTRYSRVFKSACPSAYSYAYDDGTSTFTCVGADYDITFCPQPNTSQKSSSGGQNPGSEQNNRSPLDSNMVYEGALHVSAAPSTCAHVLGATIALASAVWRLCHLF